MRVGRREKNDLLVFVRTWDKQTLILDVFGWGGAKNRERTETNSVSSVRHSRPWRGWKKLQERRCDEMRISRLPSFAVSENGKRGNEQSLVSYRWRCGLG